MFTRDARKAWSYPGSSTGCFGGVHLVRRVEQVDFWDGEA